MLLNFSSSCDCKYHVSNLTLKNTLERDLVMVARKYKGLCSTKYVISINKKFFEGDTKLYLGTLRYLFRSLFNVLAQTLIVINSKCMESITKEGAAPKSSNKIMLLFHIRYPSFLLLLSSGL